MSATQHQEVIELAFEAGATIARRLTGCVHQPWTLCDDDRGWVFNWSQWDYCIVRPDTPIAPADITADVVSSMANEILELQRTIAHLNKRCQALEAAARD